MRLFTFNPLILVISLLLFAAGCTTDTVVSPEAESSETEATEQTHGKLAPGYKTPPLEIAAISGELLIEAPVDAVIHVNSVREGSDLAIADCESEITWQQAATRTNPLGTTGCEDELQVGFIGVDETVYIYKNAGLGLYYRAHTSSAPDMTADLSSSGVFSNITCTNTKCNAQTSSIGPSELGNGTATGTYKTLYGGILENITNPPQGMSLPLSCYVSFWSGVFGNGSNKPANNTEIKVWSEVVDDDPCDLRIYDWEEI